MGRINLLGTYENFPSIHHGVFRFYSDTPIRRFQEILIRSIFDLNLARKGPCSHEVDNKRVIAEIELGIAEGMTFTYINSEIFEHLQESVRKQPFKILDFLCIARYYSITEMKKKSLRFDYHQIRIIFFENELELQIHHEKGPRRMPIQDLMDFLIQVINKNLMTGKYNPLVVTSTQTV